MEIVLLIYCAYYLATRAATDLKYAAQGKTSPRWERKLEKLRQQGQPGYQPRYGSKEWCMDLWGDMLSAKTEARRAHTAKTSGPTAPDSFLAVAGEGRPASQRIDDAFVPAQAIHLIPAAPALPAVQPAPVAPPESATEAPSNVVHMFPKKEAGSIMSEVTGLDPAIAHAQAVAEVYAEHGGGETFLAGLEAAKHGPTVLALASEARIKSSAAEAAWAMLAKALTDINKGVQEAYLASPEASGDKEHLTGGR
jgi:hypothetical protein